MCQAKINIKHYTKVTFPIQTPYHIKVYYEKIRFFLFIYDKTDDQSLEICEEIEKQVKLVNKSPYIEYFEVSKNRERANSKDNKQ